MKTLFLAATLIVVVLSAGFGWRLAVAARTAEAERATLLAAREAQNASLRRMEQRLEAVGPARAELQAALASARTPPKNATAAPAPAAGGKNAAAAAGLPNPAELLARDPRLQALYIASRRAAFATTYGPFLVTRALTPEQVQKLTDAKVRFHEQEQDLATVMFDQKLTAKDPAVATLAKRAEDDLRAATIEVLGEGGYADLQGYERTLPARAMVERFAGAAALGDVPLTAHQAERLTEIMAGAAGETRAGRGPEASRIDASRINWAAVDEQARAVLSPVQLALFQKIEPVGGGASRWMAKLNRAMQDAQQRAAPAAAKPGG